jgi:hypothetical protein
MTTTPMMRSLWFRQKRKRSSKNYSDGDDGKEDNERPSK